MKRRSAPAKGAPTNIHNDHKWSGRERHIDIDHLLFAMNRWYRRLVTCWITAQTGHVDVLHIHFKCREECCAVESQRETSDYLLYQLWLDDALGERFKASVA